MIKRLGLVLLVALPGPAAFASELQGAPALALAALTAEREVSLGAPKRLEVARLFDGMVNFPYPPGKKIVINAEKIVCRVSDVAISDRSCELTFASRSVTIEGRLANELYATILAAGVPSDGAAGSLYEALHGLACTLDPAAIKQKAGGGADCAFTPGP